MIEKLPQIEEDKANHFIYGLLIYFITMILFDNLIGIITCIIAATLKEVYDHWSPLHKWCWYDLIWTVLGGLTGLLIHIN